MKLQEYKTQIIIGGIIAVFVLLFSSVYYLGNKSLGDVQGQEPVLGGSYDDATWTVIKSFTGWQTNVDPSKISDGANAQGQNTTINDGDRISIRNFGYELFPTGDASTTESGITSLHNFRKRSGENVMLRTYSTFIEYYEEGNDTWTTLKTGLTSGLNFGWADYNINTDQHSETYFGNNTDTAMRWNGAHGLLTVAATSGATMIYTDDTTDYNTTGTIIFCGNEEAYTSKTATTFVLTGTSSVACAVDSGVAQATEAQANTPKGDIYMVANNRLFISGISSTTQAVYFSAYGDAQTFTSASLVTDSTADAAGIFNLGEGGGGVIGMTLDESSIYFFKKSIIYRATLSDSLYTLQALKPFDGRGQTVGAKSRDSIFTSGNTVFFITPDNQLMSLQRVEQIDYPQIVPISNIIQITADSMNFDESSGIVFRDRAYFSVKADTSVTYNNTVLVYNISAKAWDSPIIGVNTDHFIVYDDNTSEELYFGSNITTNVYKVNTTPVDDGYGITANWRSKQFDFGRPEVQKEVVDMYVEGYIMENTNLTISLLLDENGVSQSMQTTLSGASTTYQFSADSFNTFGLTEFGTERFGTNDQFSNRKKFRVYFSQFRAVPFYNAQVDFSSDGENQGWEVLAVGFKVRPYSVDTRRNLYKPFH